MLKMFKSKKGKSALMTFFSVMILVQLFYAFSATSLTYALGATDLNFLELHLLDLDSDNADLASISSNIQGSLETQTDIPLVELGSLVFYSGNIIIDLLLNFVFAVPEMISVLFQAFGYFMNVDAYLWAQLQVFLFTLVSISYMISIISLLTSMRSGGADLA